eukprot:scaffold6480_cov165-Amphora_coffeaeformis.AAC.7
MEAIDDTRGSLWDVLVSLGTMKVCADQLQEKLKRVQVCPLFSGKRSITLHRVRRSPEGPAKRCPQTGSQFSQAHLFTFVNIPSHFRTAPRFLKPISIQATHFSSLVNKTCRPAKS